MNQIEIARAIATQAHAGQTRRGGAPYITHPEAVAASLDKEMDKAAALLHDVMEDSQITHTQLLEAGVWPRIVQAVIHLTKQEGEDYNAYIEQVKADPIARRVKIADIRHNLSDSPKEAARIRYLKALEMLEEV